MDEAKFCNLWVLLLLKFIYSEKVRKIRLNLQVDLTFTKRNSNVASHSILYTLLMNYELTIWI